MAKRVKRYWLSCSRFTIRVETNSKGKITSAAPIARKFIGQPLSNLEHWSRKFGDFRLEVLKS